MPTSVPIHPLAAQRLKELKRRIEAEEGRAASERQIVNALIFGATPPQAAGMLIAFTREAARADAEQAVASEE